ncbi:SLC13 family permease [Halegenticoccus tardaugens]|uniref:SLC13 family permease n=1 Tax=Halegenticoccus tardaugens TaxID=2071624 RepID=UPI00100A759E|nr:SLC13 family permease [Halegenticoccus tardaugens]
MADNPSAGDDRSAQLPGLVDASGIELGGIIAAVAVVLWCVISPPPPGFTPAMQTVLAVFGFSLLLWLTKALPYVVSSSISVTLLFTLGAVETFQEATIGFASTLVFFLLLLLLLGQTIAKVDLDVWFASQLLSNGENAPRPLRSLSMNLLALSFVMPSAVARAVTFIPVVRQLSDAYGVPHDSDFERSSFLILGHVNPLASMALMTGGGMAIITSELVQSEVRPITWVEWAVYMIPPIVVLYVLSALTAERFYDALPELDAAATRSDGNGPTPENAFDVGSEDSFSDDQRIVATVMLGAVALWVVGSFVGLPTIVPAALAVCVLSLPGIRIITAADMADVSWGILFVIGTMFSILEAMESTGTLTYLVETITSLIPFASLAHWQTIVVLLSIAVIMRVFFSTASAAIIVVLPIILRFGEVLGVDQLFLALSVLIIVGSTTFLPFNTTSVLLSFDRGPLSNRDVVAFGFVTMFYASFVIAGSWLFYWPMVV